MCNVAHHYLFGSVIKAVNEVRKHLFYILGNIYIFFYVSVKDLLWIVVLWYSHQIPNQAGLTRKFIYWYVIYDRKDRGFPHHGGVGYLWQSHLGYLFKQSQCVNGIDIRLKGEGVCINFPQCGYNITQLDMKICDLVQIFLMFDGFLEGTYKILLYWPKIKRGGGVFR